MCDSKCKNCQSTILNGIYCLTYQSYFQSVLLSFHPSGVEGQMFSTDCCRAVNPLVLIVMLFLYTYINTMISFSSLLFDCLRRLRFLGVAIPNMRLFSYFIRQLFLKLSEFCYHSESIKYTFKCAKSGSQNVKNKRMQPTSSLW